MPGRKLTKAGVMTRTASSRTADSSSVPVRTVTVKAATIGSDSPTIVPGRPRTMSIPTTAPSTAYAGIAAIVGSSTIPNPSVSTTCPMTFTTEWNLGAEAWISTRRRNTMCGSGRPVMTSSVSLSIAPI
jgi:hypothetical protein